MDQDVGGSTPLGRRRAASKQHPGEDEALDQIAREAEQRLAAKRQARAEARELRMREIERQQQAQQGSKAPETDDSSSLYDTASPYSSTPSDGGGSRGSGARLNSIPRLNSHHSSRRSSEDSLDESNSLRDARVELREVEEKLRKAMIGNAQLDNEKTAASYQLLLNKDCLLDLEESNLQLQREHREKCRESDQLKREVEELRRQLHLTSEALAERDQLIQEEGLVIVGGETSSSEGEDGDQASGDREEGGDGKGRHKKKRKRALVSTESASLLSTAGDGSLDVRLKKLARERNDLSDELRHVRLELEEERVRHRGDALSSDTIAREEVSQQLAEYRFKLQKAEQDISTLQTTVARLESQVSRYKNSTEDLEKSEESLKVERRKLLRELRESQARVEELETEHTHLQKRLDKLKNAKSNLLKDL